jgi:hypothetical protein
MGLTVSLTDCKMTNNSDPSTGPLTSWDQYGVSQNLTLAPYTEPMLFLFQDNGLIKSFSNSIWTEIGPAPVTESMFTTSGMTDLSVVNNNAVQLLTGTGTKVLAYSASKNSAT